MVVMTVLTGLIYPAVMTAFSQLMFPAQANGSLLTVNGHVVGSSLLGQNFTKPEYFHPRPSSAGGGYDPTATAGSNLGPTSAKFSRDDEVMTASRRFAASDRIVTTLDTASSTVDPFAVQGRRATSMT